MPAGKVLVIGGGIGGLSTAIALLQEGVEAHVFERADALREIGAGVTIWSNASKALAHLGLGDAARRATLAIDVVQTRNTAGKVLQESRLSEISAKFGHPSVGFHRAELLQLLASTLPERLVHTGATFQRLEDSGNEVTAFFTNGENHSGDLLVGADGIFSSVRAQLLPSTRPSYAGYVCWRGVTELDPPPGWPSNSSVRSQGCGQHFGVVQLTAGRYFWYATRNQPPDEPEPTGRKATLLRHFGRWHPPIPSILDVTAEEKMLRHGIYEMRPLSTWTHGRVALLGDAAHPMRPSFGMGACQAIEDAVILAHHTKRAPEVEALRLYESERVPRAKRVVRWSQVLGRAEQAENRALCALRDINTRLFPWTGAAWLQRSFRFDIP